MRCSSLAIRSVWISATAAMAAGCGYDWGQAQRYGSCDCELVFKVVGIFDSAAVPMAQPLRSFSGKSRYEAEPTSLLSNFAFDTGAEGWQADSAVDQAWQRQALSITTKESANVRVAGSSQCQNVIGRAAYQLSADVLMPAAHGKAGASLEFFDGAGCTSRSFGTLASPSLSSDSDWRRVSLFALAPAAAKSVRARFFLIKSDASYTALFDNAVLNVSDGVESELHPDR